MYVRMHVCMYACMYVSVFGSEKQHPHSVNWEICESLQQFLQRRIYVYLFDLLAETKWCSDAVVKGADW